MVSYTKPLSSRGPLDLTGIQRVVRLRFGRYKNCTNYILARDPGFSGKGTVSLVVGSGGRVEEVSVTPDTLPEALRACLTRASKGARFAASDAGSTDVSIHLSFHSVVVNKYPEHVGAPSR